MEKSYGDVAAPFADAPAVVALDLVIGRHSGVPLETRGAIALISAETGIPIHEIGRVETGEGVVVVDEKGEEKPVEVVVAKSEPPVQPAATVEAAAPAYEAPAPAKLPDTASPFPLFGLIGVGSLIASGLVARFSKRA